MHVWDLATGAPHPANVTQHGHLGEVDSLAFAPDGRMVASSCRHDHSVRLWEASTGRLLRSLPVTEELTAHALTFTPDGKHLLVGTSPAIVRWEVATGKEVGRYPLLSEPGKGERHHLMTLHLTDDGRTLLAVSQNLAFPFPPQGNDEGQYGLHSWDVATGKHLHFGPLSAGGYSVGYNHFSADGRLLLIPGESIREAATGKKVFHPSLSDGKLWGTPVAFSPDGARFAAGVWQKITRPNVMGQEMVAVQVWELSTLLPIVRLETRELAHMAFTLDGRRLITAGPEALKLWDLASAREVARQPAHGRFRGSYGESFASCLALAPDGHTVATGHVDTTILLWDLSPAKADRAGAPLTTAQLEDCWTDLAGADGGRILMAMNCLADAPEQTMVLFRDRLRPVKAPPSEELSRLLGDLDASQFARREAATKRLTDLAELADAALQEALRQQPSLEARRRIESLLAVPQLVKTPEARRHLRAVRILEWIRTTEARQLLKKLAGGAPEATLTKEAAASLRRLARER